jgi:signal peptidase II
MSFLVIDQITKAVVRATMHVGDSFGGFIPFLINLTYVRNSGAAFGLFPGQRPVFLLTSALVLFVIAAYWRRARPHQWPVVIALAMIAGGSVGNLIDRALVGHVTDFFEFAFVQFPVFNVADIGIVGGVGVLMAWVLFGPEPPAAASETDDAEPCADTVADAVPDADADPDTGERSAAVTGSTATSELTSTDTPSAEVGRAES